MDHINNCLLSGPWLPPLSTPSSYCCSSWTLRSPASLPPPPPTIGQPGRAGDRLGSFTLPVPSRRTSLLFLTWLAVNDSFP